MYRNILIALGSGPDADAALDASIWLTRAFGGVLHGVHVVDPGVYESAVAPDLSGGIGFEPLYRSSEDFRRRLEEQAGKILDRFVEAGRRESVRCQSYTPRNTIVGGIEEELRHADLLVVGARGTRTSQDSHLLGVTTEAVVRSSSKPVLVVPAPFRNISRPMLAYDESVRATNALLRAAVFCERLKLRLRVVTAGGRDEGERRIDEVRTYLEPYGVEIDGEVRSGEAERVVLETAREFESDLIFLGSHGKGRILEIVLGSTTEAVLRQSSVPVMCCI